MRKRISFFDELTVAEYAERDIRFFRALGARFYTWFQIKDGFPDDPDFEAHFGIYHSDGAAKAVAKTMRGAL